MRKFIAFAAFAAVVGACSGSPSTEPTSTDGVPLVTAPECRTMWAGQHTDVGQVCVWSDGVTLFFEYEFDGPWLVEAHTWAGITDQYPGWPSSPAPGQLAKAPNGVKGEFNPPVASYTAEIPLSAVGAGCGEPFYFLAHASLTSGETAWSDGSAAPGGSWAMISSGEVYCPENPDPEPEVTCETAFAYGEARATCFDQYGISRWGWTNLFQGPLPVEGVEMPLLAGAAHCSPDAFQAGVVKVTHDGTKFDVRYEVWGAFYLEETHLYVGTTALPKTKKGADTVAPGQFGNQHELDEAGSDSYAIEGDLPGYLIAHAVVCGADWSTEPSPPNDPM